MASNCMVVCPKCRVGRKSNAASSCPRCHTPELNFGKRTTLPKKNNRKAWKRIASGEFLWDRRRVRNGYGYGPNADLGG